MPTVPPRPPLHTAVAAAAVTGRSPRVTRIIVTRRAVRRATIVTEVAAAAAAAAAAAIVMAVVTADGMAVGVGIHRGVARRRRRRAAEQENRKIS